MMVGIRKVLMIMEILMDLERMAILFSEAIQLDYQLNFKKYVMKKIIKNILIVLLSISFSCEGDSILEEKPLDFYTPDNSLQTGSQFQASINFLYNKLRDFNYGLTYNLDGFFSLRYATDFAVNATDYEPPVKLNDYKNTMVPTFNVPNAIWQQLY